MASSAEQAISRSLRVILADQRSGENIPDSEQFQRVLIGLEWFLPDVLAEVYPEWETESLDGIYPVLARKSGDGEAEIFGRCLFISDQTLTPLHVRLQISSQKDEISWFECRLGEKSEHGVVKTPYHRFDASSKRLHSMGGRADKIDWVYKVTFGERQT